MKILLVGGLGYIGSTLVEHIRKTESSDHVTILDPLVFDVEPYYFHRVLSDDRFRFIKSDVSDMRHTWDMIGRHDVIVYMASLTLPATSKFPEEGIFVNRHMAEVVGDCCAKFGKKMVFMSTCSNYGRSDKPVAESGELLPISMYARTKVDAERYLIQKVPNITILRCATAYGIGAGRTRWDVLFNNFVKKAVTDGVIDLFQPDACRPVCHVDDISQAIWKAATIQSGSESSIYNVGSNEQNYTKKELAEIAVSHVPDARIEMISSDDDRDYRVDFSKIHKDFGFKAQHTPDSELARLASLCKQRKTVSDTVQTNTSEKK